MPRKLLMLLLLLGAFVFGLMLDHANAAVAGPGSVNSRGLTSGLTEVHWVCGRYRCSWRPNYRGVVAPYARGWGPPRRVGCYWSRTRHGRWVEVCR